MVFITLGNGNEFGINDHGELVFTHVRGGHIIQAFNLGPATLENFQKIIRHMKQLEIHMEKRNANDNHNE